MTETEKNLRKNIGMKIKLARSKTNYTQEVLAEKASLSPRFVSQLERGISFGSATTIVNLCKALNISSDFLFNDLILSNSDSVPEFDSKLFENYCQLNDYNKMCYEKLSPYLSGHDLEYLREHIKTFNPKSVKICTLLSKPSRRIFELNVDYIGFSIPDEFVVGFGMDYNQKYRNLPYIGKIG